MRLSMFQVDAFADRLFSGNPAAVCPLEEWLPDGVMQAIADENNLAETAFFAPEGDDYRLRWFTPEAEVDLCGHATLASAHVLFEHIGYVKDEIRFHTRSGVLVVTKRNGGLQMDFPASALTPCEMPEALMEGLGARPAKVFSASDYVAVFETEKEIRDLRPNFLRLEDLDLRGVCATAPGDTVDFVSRFFAPKYRINEDPVTGSAHCEIAPYWASVLGRNWLSARQLSKRGGSVTCEVVGDRVLLSGKCVDFLRGEIRTTDD
jgi:PhzF family phenazine biosynthesis protein